jgi:hypothetical protein
MGWHKTAVLGDKVVEIRFSRRGQFHRHLDTGSVADEKLRLSGRHLRLVMRHQGWEALSDEERDARLHDRM